MRKSRHFTIAGVRMVVSLILVCMLTFGLSGCGNKTEKKDDRITTEDSAEQDEVKIDVDEPDQPIADGVNLNENEETTSDSDVPDVADAMDETETMTEADTTSSAPGTTGAYSYTIYDGIEINMDVNIDDYMFTGIANGAQCFDLGALAQDYGWVYTREETGDYSYRYDYGDMAIVFAFYCDRDTDADKISGFYDDYQMTIIEYTFAQQSDNDDLYYSSFDHSNQSLVLDLMDHGSICEYEIYPSVKICGSRSDIIIIAYLISSAKTNPGVNPFSLVDFMNYSSGRGNTGIETYYLP
ncbi:MAG: hypothetical protein IJ224_01925 [Lachnospiraceae bacterium]|nr:hypothetical protein [Lachnospiraceae bacterium]